MSVVPPRDNRTLFVARLFREGSHATAPAKRREYEWKPGRPDVPLDIPTLMEAATVRERLLSVTAVLDPTTPLRSRLGLDSQS